MISLYLVDDHAVLRDGLKAVLEGHGHHVLGGTHDPTQALADLVRLKPQVLLLDLNLGTRSGFEVLEDLRRRDLPVRTLVLTMSAHPRHLQEAMRLGAAGYLLKGSSAGEVVRAVEAVARGDRYTNAETAELAVRALALPQGEPRLGALSARERQVVTLVVQGKSSSEIGELLHLSPKTVDSYRSRLMAKLGVSDVPGLVRLAMRLGLIDPLP